MPDCVSNCCKLEHFLGTLIPEGDLLWVHARESTGHAILKCGAGFGDSNREKAVVHCWLAWQKDPGTPFGTAIKAKFLGSDSGAARTFVKWLSDIYGFKVASAC
jgi:hypothetical protein